MAQAYGLSQDQVAADAILVQTARGPRDDLFSALRERHAWSAGITFRYLRMLRGALRNQLPT